MTSSFKRPLAASVSFLAALATIVAVGACGDADTDFNIKYAPTFQRGGMTVSVLGVFREGRMSPETWDDIGPKISTAFGRGLCPTGYDTKLIADHADLAAAIDDYTRANGVTDDLLDQLAPAASGDAVLVITVAGRPVWARTDAGVGAPPQTSAPTAPGRGSQGMRGHGGGMGTPTPMRLAIDRNAFEMSASIFSVHDHRSVALVSMGYSGTSGADALQKFVAKLRESLPTFPCVGWHMDTPIDEKKIQEITKE
jgi:hypothetical protein